MISRIRLLQIKDELKEAEDGDIAGEGVLEDLSAINKHFGGPLDKAKTSVESAIELVNMGLDYYDKKGKWTDIGADFPVETLERFKAEKRNLLIFEDHGLRRSFRVMRNSPPHLYVVEIQLVSVEEAEKLAGAKKFVPKKKRKKR